MGPHSERELPREILEALKSGEITFRTRADLAVLRRLIDQGIPNGEIILQFNKRDLRDLDSTYPLGRLLTELNWDVGPLGYNDLFVTFTGDSGEPFRTVLEERDLDAIRTIGAIQDRLSNFSLSHYLEIKGWLEHVIHEAMLNDTCQLQVGSLVTMFMKGHTDRTLPVTVSRYQSESALRLALAFFSLRDIKDELLQPPTQVSCLRQDSEYGATHPMTLVSGEPLVVAKSGAEYILTSLQAPMEKRELNLISPPERLTGRITSLRTDHSTFIAAITQRIKDTQIVIWDLHKTGSAPTTKIQGKFADCLLFKRPDEVTPCVAAITAQGKCETFSLEGERLSSTLISDDFPQGYRHAYTLLFADFSDTAGRIFIRTDRGIASVSLRPGSPQIVVGEVLSMPLEGLWPQGPDHFWSIQDCCLTSVEGSTQLAVLRKDNVIFFLDIDTLQQASAPLQVCDRENYGMCLVPNCLGFDLLLGKLASGGHSPVLEGISLPERRVTPIETPLGDIVSIVPLPGETRPGVFVPRWFSDPPTVVFLDPEGHVKTEVITSIPQHDYLTVV